MAGVPTRALTAAPRIKPTSIRCRSARQRNSGRTSTYRRGIAVQTTGAISAGAAWAMTQMTLSADKIALVQTALMLPAMLLSLPASAIADMHDRRIVR